MSSSGRSSCPRSRRNFFIRVMSVVVSTVDGSGRRRLHLFEAGAAHHRGHADLLDRLGMRGRQAAEEVGADFHHDDVADARARSPSAARRSAATSRRSSRRARSAPALRAPARAPRSPSPTGRRTSTALLPLLDDRLAAAVDGHRRGRARSGCGAPAAASRRDPTLASSCSRPSPSALTFGRDPARCSYWTWMRPRDLDVVALERVVDRRAHLVHRRVVLPVSRRSRTARGR